MQNPYAARNMIKEVSDFFGRRNQIEGIFRNLKTIPFQNTSIVGERRCGKSSLLWHISQPQVHDRFVEEGEKPFIFIFFDLQKVANLNQNTFFRLLTECLIKQLPEKPDISQDNYDTYQEYFYELVDESAERFRIVVCLDEFETIRANDQFDATFLFSLRSLGNSGKVAYVTSSRDRLYEIIHTTDGLKGSDFWNIFVEPPIFLGLLRRDEARELVTVPAAKAGVTFLPSDTEYVFELAGHHPLFLQLACFHLFEEKKIREEAGNDLELDHLARQRVRDNFLLGAMPHFDHIWSRLSPAEKSLVADCRTVDPEGESKKMIVELVRRGILVSDGTLRPFSVAFENYATENLSSSRAAAASPAGASAPTADAAAGVIGAGLKDTRPTGGRPPSAVTTEAKLDIWIGRKAEVLINFSGPYSISQFCPNQASIKADTIKRFDNRVKRLPQIDNWRAEKDEIGKDVFDLFEQTPELSQIYTGGRSAVEDDENFLLTFRCPQEMLAFPFEFLNCLSSVDEGQKHLVLSHPMRKSIVGIRSKKTPLPPDFYRDERKRILLVSSNVSGGFNFRGKPYHLPEIPGATKEIKALEGLINELRKGGDFLSTVDVRYDVTGEEMAELLQYGRYDVVHFSGHGMYSDSPESSCLFFWKKPGGKHAGNEIESLTANELNVLVEGTGVRFVYLSCCQGAVVGAADQLLSNDFLGIAHSLLVGGVPSILSMRWPLSDDMAILLASSFYRQLFRGGGIEKSLFKARRQAQSRMPNDYNWLSPVLIVQGDY